MSSSKILKRFKEIYDNGKERFKYYADHESVARGTKHMLADSLRDPWDLVKSREHTASKVILAPLMAVNNIVTASITPVSSLLFGAQLALYKCGKEKPTQPENANAEKVTPPNRNIYRRN